jgi:hypothetical protein
MKTSLLLLALIASLAFGCVTRHDSSADLAPRVIVDYNATPIHISDRQVLIVNHTDAALVLMDKDGNKLDTISPRERYLIQLWPPQTPHRLAILVRPARLDGIKPLAYNHTFAGPETNTWHIKEFEAK